MVMESRVSNLFGRYGWCYTNPSKTEWGFCSKICQSNSTNENRGQNVAQFQTYKYVYERDCFLLHISTKFP